MAVNRVVHVVILTRILPTHPRPRSAQHCPTRGHRGRMVDEVDGGWLSHRQGMRHGMMVRVVAERRRRMQHTAEISVQHLQTVQTTRWSLLALRHLSLVVVMEVVLQLAGQGRRQTAKGASSRRT